MRIGLVRRSGQVRRLNLPAARFPSAFDEAGEGGGDDARHARVRDGGPGDAQEELDVERDGEYGGEGGEKAGSALAQDRTSRGLEQPFLQHRDEGGEQEQCSDASGEQNGGDEDADRLVGYERGRE